MKPIEKRDSRILAWDPEAIEQYWSHYQLLDTAEICTIDETDPISGKAWQTACIEEEISGRTSGPS